jgi:hypothetical protein
MNARERTLLAEKRGKSRRRKEGPSSRRCNEKESSDLGRRKYAKMRIGLEDFIYFRVQ